MHLLSRAKAWLFIFLMTHSELRYKFVNFKLGFSRKFSALIPMVVFMWLCGFNVVSIIEHRDAMEINHSPAFFGGVKFNSLALKGDYFSLFNVLFFESKAPNK